MRPRSSAAIGLCAAIALAATSASAAVDLREFARCLTRAGVTYYTAAWCPHCARQNQTFGAALRYLHVVDCTDGCVGVGSFPTWVFANGSRVSGFASLEMLASRTGCGLGREGREGTDDSDATQSSGEFGTRRQVGGVTIIEVPHR